MRAVSGDPYAQGRSYGVRDAVIEGVHLFQGITDATMGHGEGWRYLRPAAFSSAPRRRLR